MGLNLVIMFGLIIILLSTRMPVAIAIGASGLVATVLLADFSQAVGSVIYNTLASYVLAAIPMFVFMGEIVLRSGLSNRLYSGVSKWTSILPGGLIHSNIASCALFACISGSSVATAATIGTVAYPEQERRGYDKRIVTGSLTAGGTLGPMIPPSMGMILYGAVTGNSVAKLFIGTAIPGFMNATLFMIYILIRHVLNPSLSPKPEPIRPSYFSNAARACVEIWPVALLMLIIFIGIYGGFMTPTEAAAISSFVAICLALAFRALTFNAVKEAALRSLEVTCFVFLIIISANLLAAGMAMLMIPKQLCAAAAASGFHPLAIWGLLILLWLSLGCFMDEIAIFFLTIAVAYPLMMSLGFDPIWFGVIHTMTLMTASLTPPIGMNLYVIQAITKIPFSDVVKGSAPFVFIMLVGVSLVTFFPQLATWLPSTMMG